MYTYLCVTKDFDLLRNYSNFVCSPIQTSKSFISIYGKDKTKIFLYVINFINMNKFRVR